LKRLGIITLLILYTAFEGVNSWPAHPLLATILSMLVFIVMLQWIFIYHAKPQLINKPWFKTLTWIGTFAMGFWSTFILLSLPANIILFIKYIIEYFTTPFPQSNFTFYTVNLALLGIAGVINILGLIEVIRGPRVKLISLPLPTLPHDLNNLKLAQISDLHIGPTIGTSYVENVVKLTNSTQPDMIFITGDLADANPDQIDIQLQALGKLSSRYGTYFVTGNHEYYWNASELITKLKNLNISTLVNENKILQINNSKIMIAGVTDPVGASMPNHQPNMTLALATNEIIDFKILLAHRPGVYVEAEKMNVDLQFSGHTHAGQFFPFNLLMPLAHKYYKGLNKIGNLCLYVNPGTGYWGPANRFGIPAEITSLKLSTAST
jgi:predicted MPP superfamily phosphohydrolase